VSPGIQLGDRQHSAGKLFIGEGAGAGRWGKSGQSRDHDIPYPLAHFCCCFLRGVRPGGGQNVCFSCLAIYLFRTHARPQNSGFHKIASRISGSLPALATAGSGGRWHFFCSRHTQLWLKTPPTKRDVKGPVNCPDLKGRPPCSGPSSTYSRNGVPIVDEFLFPRHANVEHNSSKIGRPIYRPSNPRPSDAILCDRFSGMVGENAESVACGQLALPDWGMGPEMLEPMERQNRPLVAYIFPQNRGSLRRLASRDPRLLDDVGACQTSQYNLGHRFV